MCSLRHPHLCAGAFCPRDPGGHHEAQAVRQGHGADRPGGRHPDLPRPGRGMEEVIVGVVGVLQLEVLEYRLKNEYNVDIRLQNLPYEYIRWILNSPDELDPKMLDITSDTRCIEDLKGNACCCSPAPGASMGRPAQRHFEAERVRQPDLLICRILRFSNFKHKSSAFPRLLWGRRCFCSAIFPYFCHIEITLAPAEYRVPCKTCIVPPAASAKAKGSAHFHKSIPVLFRPCHTRQL